MTYARIPGNISIPSGSTVGVAFTDSPQRDAFGRLRVASPTNIFDTQLQYNEQPLLWSTLTATTSDATFSHLPDESAVRLTVGTTDADSVIRQTRRYLRYQPGKSQQISMTGVFGSSTSNVVKRLGYFDDENGIFFEDDGVNLNVVERTNTSGSTAEDRVALANWNLDVFDGQGASAASVDFARNNIYTIDLEWLSIGRVRTGLTVDGETVYGHEFLHNGLDMPYMTTANLPLRYEISNVGAPSSADSMKQICVMVVSEGGRDQERTINHGVSGPTAAVTTRRPILTIRPKSTFGTSSITNHGHVLDIITDVIASSNNALVEVIFGGSATSATWQDRGDNSLVEYDSNSTEISGGEVVATFFVVSGQANRSTTGSKDLDERLLLAYDSLKDVADEMSIVVTSLNATTNVLGALNWGELY
ncbi:hypothetical protein LCGC14_1954270 [marine sediment metagenome]|uniref:Uncharacterized protein n=1 Tax=marine sediment metagenome TaxID=412755 RepID=A0A0F9G4V3_9ZZZZ